VRALPSRTHADDEAWQHVLALPARRERPALRTLSAAAGADVSGVRGVSVLRRV